MYKSFFKRIFDFTIALLLFILLLPVFLILVFGIWIITGSSPFFTQVRPGRNGKHFRLMKFKSMNEKKDASGKLLPDMQRLTGVGRFIRQTSLDELPQLLNVIKGDMSLIGPRPLLVEYLPLYSNFQARRHEVLPGITGWAQVNGRNAISWQQKFEYDVWYVEHLSFSTDMKIIFRTIQRIFRHHDVNAGEQITMDKFAGNKE